MKYDNELTLYKRSSNFLWTDPYIAKNMLKAHLDFTNDAASRNIKTINKTVNWIAPKIKGKRVLDLGCGPGLYSSILAGRGFDVTGVDISASSIDYAKESAKKCNLDVNFLCMDYLNGDFGGGFDAIICIYCDFGALIPSEREIFLKKVHGALNVGGVFIFDVFGDGISLCKNEFRNWRFSDGGDFWCESSYLALEECRHFPDSFAWGSRNVIIEENGFSREFITWDSYFSKDGVSLILENSGFKAVSFNNRLVESSNFTSSDVIFTCAVKV